MQSVHDYLNGIISRLPQENPLEYIQTMYKHINPALIFEAVNGYREALKKEKPSKNGNEIDLFLTLGGDSLNQSFFNGIIAALLWLPNYISDMFSNKTISKQERDITKHVLNKIHLPQVIDAHRETIDGVIKTIEPSNVAHYSLFLIAITSWLTSGISSFKVVGDMKSNMEISRYLTALALESFPSVPFGAYYIGSIKTENPSDVATRIGKTVQITEYLSEKSYLINQPKLQIVSRNAPLIGIVGHPCSEMFIAEISNGESKWLGLYTETEEFKKQCSKHGFISNDIKKYIIANSLESHNKNLSNNDPYAKFVENEKIAKMAFNMRHKKLEPIEEEKNNLENL